MFHIGFHIFDRWSVARFQGCGQRLISRRGCHGSVSWEFHRFTKKSGKGKQKQHTKATKATYFLKLFIVHPEFVLAT